MAASSEPSGDAADPLMYSSAAGYARDRLRESDRPLTPGDLAEEYDCGGDHMRHTLCDLVADGEAERVDRGLYVHAEEAAEESSDESAEEDASSGEENMPSDEEYQRQSTLVEPEITEEERAEPTEEQAGEESEESTSEDETSGGFPAISAEMMLLLSLAAFALIVYLRTRSDGDESAESAPEEPQEQEEEDTGEIPLIE